MFPCFSWVQPRSVFVLSNFCEGRFEVLMWSLRFPLKNRCLTPFDASRGNLPSDPFWSDQVGRYLSILTCENAEDGTIWKDGKTSWFTGTLRLWDGSVGRIVKIWCYTGCRWLSGSRLIDPTLFLPSKCTSNDKPLIKWRLKIDRTILGHGLPPDSLAFRLGISLTPWLFPSRSCEALRKADFSGTASAVFSAKGCRGDRT